VSHDVFLCYATENSEAVNTLCNALEREGMQCWMAPRDIDPGVAYASSIVRAISSARLFVLVFSHFANASPHVSRELERAVNMKVPIVPLLIEDTEPSDEIAYYISSTQWHIAHPPPLEGHLTGILETIRRGLARTGEYAPSPGQDLAGAADPRSADDNALPNATERAKRRIPLVAVVTAAVLTAAAALAAILLLTGDGGSDATTPPAPPTATVSGDTDVCAATSAADSPPITFTSHLGPSVTKGHWLDASDKVVSRDPHSAVYRFFGTGFSDVRLVVQNSAGASYTAALKVYAHPC
jgi:hypothetical protein